MLNKLIEQYVNRMTTDDITDFAEKNGIELTNEETDLIYNHIKSSWKTIIYGNPRDTFDDIKAKASNATYEKITNLYVHFREKYKIYL